MSDFLGPEDCLPNLNAVTVAGKVLKVEPLQKIPGLRVTIGYQKTWPNGGSQEIPIPCYLTGAERVAKLAWLQVGRGGGDPWRSDRQGRGVCAFP